MELGMIISMKQVIACELNLQIEAIACQTIFPKTENKLYSSIRYQVALEFLLRDRKNLDKYNSFYY